MKVTSNMMNICFVLIILTGACNQTTIVCNLNNFKLSRVKLIHYFPMKNLKKYFILAEDLI